MVKLVCVDMELEDEILCPKCKKPTVYYLFNSGRKTIKFYPEPHLAETEIKHPTLQMRKVPNKDDSTKYDVILSCPKCGEDLFAYSGVPLDWECFDTPGSLVCIPLDDLKPWTVFDSRKSLKGESA